MLRSGEDKGVEDDYSMAALVSCEPGVMPSKKNIRKCEDKVCPQYFERFSYLHRYTLSRLAKYSLAIFLNLPNISHQTQTNHRKQNT